MPTRWIGNPQPAEFVRVSTELLLALARTPMNDRENRIVLALLAASYGRHDDSTRVTRAHLSRLTGLSMPQVMKGLAELAARGIIVMGELERGKPVLLAVQKRYATWTDGAPVDHGVEDVYRALPRGLPPEHESGQPAPDQLSILVSPGKLGVSQGKLNSADLQDEPTPRYIDAAKAAKSPMHPTEYGCGCTDLDGLNPHPLHGATWAEHELAQRTAMAEAERTELLSRYDPNVVPFAARPTPAPTQPSGATIAAHQAGATKPVSNPHHARRTNPASAFKPTALSDAPAIVPPPERKARK